MTAPKAPIPAPAWRDPGGAVASQRAWRCHSALGPIVAAGWLAALATGAVAVGATGGIIGALVESGASKENAELYAEALRRGGAIVTAKVPDKDEAKYAAIMDEFAFYIAAREADYRKAGWTGYDPSAPAYSVEQVRKEREIYRM